MVYCTSCGSPNPAGEVVCEVCGAVLPRTGATGAAQPPPPQQPPPRPQPAQSAPPAQPRPAPVPQPSAVPPRRRGPSPEELSSSEQLGLLVGNVCLSPLLGVVLYYVWRDRHPVRAGQACTLTRWAVGLWVAFILLVMIAGVLSEL